MDIVLGTLNQSERADVGMADTVLSTSDPEVLEKKKARYFTARYKIRILAEVDACKSPGEIGAILRREGLYHSKLKTWRRQRDQGILGGLTPKKRGRKPVEVNPLAGQVARLEKENKRLMDLTHYSIF
jgi:transposase-like protein